MKCRVLPKYPFKGFPEEKCKRYLSKKVYTVPSRANTPLPHQTIKESPTDPVISKTPLGEMKIPEPR